MNIPIYQVDAFAGRVFSGNPAAVCPLEGWLPEQTLQAIAAENNLSETAFLVPAGEDYELRWFTPRIEVDLCGHATLAAGFVVLTLFNTDRASVRFHTRSGPLTVTREERLFALDLPARPAQPAQISQALIAALGGRPSEVWAGAYYLAIYGTAEEVAALTPDLGALKSMDKIGMIATAPGHAMTGAWTGACDFVSRFFAPRAGIDEDPVTGSAHCMLVPYWARRLGKRRLVARQISARGGLLMCEDQGERVKIAGEAALYLEGQIRV